MKYTVVLKAPETLREHFESLSTDIDRDGYYTALVEAESLPEAVKKAKAEYAAATRKDGGKVNANQFKVVIVFKDHPDIVMFSFQTHLLKE